MDQKIQNYINSLISQIPSQNEENTQKLREHFNEVVFETLINNLSSEQLNTLKNLGLASVQAQKKIEEYSSLIPSFSTKLEDALNAEVEKIKNMQSGEV